MNQFNFLHTKYFLISTITIFLSLLFINSALAASFTALSELPDLDIGKEKIFFSSQLLKGKYL